jgi:hypothetical protein
MRAIAALVLMTMLLAGCGSATGDTTGTVPKGRLVVTVLAWPTCPVEQAGTPCDPRPPQRVTLVVERLSGERVAQVAARAGHVTLGGLPAGRYRLISQPVSGLMGTPAPVGFSIAAGAATHIHLTYDTGIR